MSGVTKVGQKSVPYIVPHEDADVGSGLGWF